MSFLRPSSNILLSSRRAAPLSARIPPPLRYISPTIPRLSNQGYGEGKGDPAAENSERSTKTQEGHEHPGPAAPEGKGSGGSRPTKAKPEDASANSGGSRSKEVRETGSSPTGEQIRNSSVDAETKIHDNQTPGHGGHDGM
ncbi:hypothetical protein B0O99DRAFT_675128 [Bisporella sp. PMI_857]|nr:hypothetical protein B0O99DRAFT_675128 [Bisporella sp. PMI_857]